MQGALCTGSRRFKHIAPQRTFSHYILMKIARNREFFYTSSGWFDCTEPSPTTSLQGRERVQGALCTSSMRFTHSELQRTFSNYILTERARCIDFFHTSSGWFHCTEPSQTTYSSSGDTRCAGCTMHRFGEVQAQRTSSNLIKLHPHRASKV